VLFLESSKRWIAVLTIVMFIYNVILGYLVIGVTAPAGRIPLLILIAADYFIIYYFVSGAAQIKKYKDGKRRRKRR
jgi:hypothetical protein